MNNVVLRRIRYALNLSDSKMIKIFSEVGYEIDCPTLVAYLKKDTDPTFAECSDETLASFLDGLIAERRGKQEDAPPPVKKLDNNLILRKIKIALSLRDSDMMTILNTVDFKISKAELNALFQKKGHRNYKVCGDQFLRNFMLGLTRQMRGDDKKK